MPGGVSLGSAYFTLDASAAGLISALNAAEQASKKSVQAISAATGVAEKDVQRLANTYVAAEKRRADAAAAATLKIIKAHNDAAAAADKATAQQVKASQQSTQGFLSLSKSLTGFTGVAAAATIGIGALGAAMSKIGDETQKAAQAQFALNALYGAASPIITKFAEDQAQAIGRSKTDAKEAAASVATLARNYALTGEQIQKVLTISANLAAVRGISLEAAAERTQSALRGEAEAIEYLGVALQSGALKALADMTDEQRKHFETLNDVTKAQIILNALTDQTSSLQGQAAKRTQDAAGASDNLKAKIDDLAASIGKILTPGIVGSTNAMADLVKEITKYSDAVSKLPSQQDATEKSMSAVVVTAISMLGPLGQLAAAYIAVRNAAGEAAAAQAGIQIGPDPGMPGATAPGPTSPATAQAIADDAARRKQAAAAAKDAIAAFVENRKRAIKDIADADEARYRREAKAADDAIDQEKIRLEVEKAARLKELEERERATIKTIEAEGKAEQQGFEDVINRLELEKKARIAAADAAKDQALAAIEVEKTRRDHVRETEDRATTDAREAEDRDLSDSREKQDRAEEAAHQKKLRRIEDAHTKAIRAIEAEADRERKKSDDAIRGLERQATREDDRHRKALANIDKERDAQLAILDVQLKALDAADKSEQAAKRTADLQKAVAAAQQAAMAAHGTGTPAEIAAARGDLTGAIRVGNEVSIANARERLVKLAGQGNEAIQKADEDLLKAQDDLRQEGVDNQRDAEREQIKTAQDAIRDKADAEKKAEDDRDRRRKAELDKDKQDQQDRLKDILDKLDKRKQAESDAHDDRIRKDRDEFGQAGQRRQDARQAEDRQIKDNREAQDRRRADERKAEDEALDAQRTAVAKEYENERADADEHYNGAAGLITIVKKAMDDAKFAYQQRLDDAKLRFGEERDEINAVYRNPGKTGLLDLQDQAAENNRNRLADQLAALASWKDQANQWIDDNRGKWESLTKAIEETAKAISRLPGAPRGGVNGPIGSDNGAPVYGPADPGNSNALVPADKVDQRIRNAFAVLGYQAEQDALEVWAGEGKSAYVGDNGSSFGPFQLHYGGLAGGGNSGKGLGDQFTQDTGLDARDPNTWKEQIDWVRDYVKKNGWNGQWHGAPSNIKNKHYALGGWITEPVSGIGMRSGAAYSFAEAAPEYVSPARGYSGSAPGPPLPDYRAMGQTMLAAHPSANGGGHTGDVNHWTVNNVNGSKEVARQISREQRKRSLLHGVRRLR